MSDEDRVKKAVDAVADAKLDGVLPEELKKQKPKASGGAAGKASGGEDEFALWESKRRHAVVKRHDRPRQGYGPNGFAKVSLREEKAEEVDVEDKKWRQAQMNKARWSMLDVLERHGFVVRGAGQSLQFKREMEKALGQWFVLVDPKLDTREKAVAVRKRIMEEQAEAQRQCWRTNTGQVDGEREPGEEG